MSDFARYRISSHSDLYYNKTGQKQTSSMIPNSNKSMTKCVNLTSSLRTTNLYLSNATLAWWSICKRFGTSKELMGPIWSSCKSIQIHSYQNQGQRLSLQLAGHQTYQTSTPSANTNATIQNVERHFIRYAFWSNTWRCILNISSDSFAMYAIKPL